MLSSSRNPADLCAATRQNWTCLISLWQHSGKKWTEKETRWNRKSASRRASVPLCPCAGILRGTRLYEPHPWGGNRERATCICIMNQNVFIVVPLWQGNFGCWLVECPRKTRCEKSSTLQLWMLNLQDKCQESWTIRPYRRLWLANRFWPPKKTNPRKNAAQLFFENLEVKENEKEAKENAKEAKERAQEARASAEKAFAAVQIAQKNEAKAEQEVKVSEAARLEAAEQYAREQKLGVERAWFEFPPKGVLLGIDTGWFRYNYVYQIDGWTFSIGSNFAAYIVLLLWWARQIRSWVNAAEEKSCDGYEQICATMPGPVHGRDWVLAT